MLEQSVRSSGPFRFNGIHLEQLEGLQTGLPQGGEMAPVALADI